MKKLRTCIVCGTKYEYCGSCAGAIKSETWRNIYHDQNCREAFNIISNFNSGKLNKEEAKAKLTALNISSYVDGIKEDVDKIMEVTHEVSFIEPSENSFKKNKKKIVNED